MVAIGSSASIVTASLLARSMGNALIAYICVFVQPHLVPESLLCQFGFRVVRSMDRVGGIPEVIESVLGSHASASDGGIG